MNFNCSTVKNAYADTSTRTKMAFHFLLLNRADLGNQTVHNIWTNTPKPVLGLKPKPVSTKTCTRLF